LDGSGQQTSPQLTGGVGGGGGEGLITMTPLVLPITPLLLLIFPPIVAFGSTSLESTFAVTSSSEGAADEQPTMSIAATAAADKSVLAVQAFIIPRLG